MIILVPYTDGSKYGSTESTILWAVSLQFPLYVSLVGRDVDLSIDRHPDVNPIVVTHFYPISTVYLTTQNSLILIYAHL